MVGGSQPWGDTAQSQPWGWPELLQTQLSREPLFKQRQPHTQFPKHSSRGIPALLPNSLLPGSTSLPAQPGKGGVSVSASSSCHGAAPQQGRLRGDRMGMMLFLIPIPEGWEETSHPVTTLITPRGCTGLCLTLFAPKEVQLLLPTCLPSFPAHRRHGSCCSAPRRELGTAKMETGRIKMDGASLSFPSTFPRTA